ncbi:hypothetical protein B7P43_G11900 [Cryptotermes secundus]|uniref:Uncharacterized protein n=1 Tax=Cryptotermes secundus TaxID=105785 RepID=A0A2J7Q6T0_9NEOP|nr:hypothetical protein B7P43_G11900 [Cryptotermes secundus]
MAKFAVIRQFPGERFLVLNLCRLCTTGLQHDQALLSPPKHITVNSLLVVLVHLATSC